MSGLTWVAFLVAAGIGAPARYVVDTIVQERTDGVYPWGTLVVNVSGCLILGVITGLAMYHGLGGSAKTVLGTGAMGAYTTFSTFTFETVRLVEEGAGRLAARNVAASVVLGLAAAALGLAVTAW
jgi:fluoride exporter